MTVIATSKIVVLGMMSKMPVGGVVWQTIHYLVGLERMGYEVYYVEAHARTPSMFSVAEGDDGSLAAAGFIGSVMTRFGMGDRWAFQALHSDGATYGMSAGRLAAVYREATLIINLHGGTLPRPEHTAGGNLVYLETDPVTLQVELEHGVQASIDFLEPHVAFFTFAENLGGPDCGLPISTRFPFVGTRQPVVVDMWDRLDIEPRDVFTTVGNWRQQWREVTYRDSTYHWSKHHEFLKFIDLPTRTAQPFELALSSSTAEDRRLLEDHGWTVVDGLSVSMDANDYRRYICRSRGEFTVAKDQNVRLRTGWFSDRSATYLAAGRPVVTQDTAFGAVLPTGSGLFPFTTTDEIVVAVERIVADLPAQRQAARAIAREYFSHEVVLGDILAALGMPRHGRRTSIPSSMKLAPLSRNPIVLPPETGAAARQLPLYEGPSVDTGRADATVIVITYNNLAFTRLCVDSVLAHTEIGRYELIVVDNGSIDGTPEYLAALGKRHRHVRPILNRDNRGFAAACNQGVTHSRAGHLVLLNNDAIVPPGWLGALLAHLSDQSVGAVGPVTNRIGNEAQIETDYETFNEFVDFADQRRREHAGRTTDVSMLAMFCFAMRRDVHEAIGPLDEQYGVGLLEDDDYAARLRLAGYRLVCAEDVFVHHFGEASFGHLYPTGAYQRILRENKARYHAKWGIEWQPYRRRPEKSYDQVVEQTRQEVLRHVPPGETVLVISRGDERLVSIEARVAWHFPQTTDGVWAGHYPADSDAAVALLDQQIKQGARYLVVPRTGTWWLEHYRGLERHLGEEATAIHADDLCRIFKLTEPIVAGSRARGSTASGEGIS